MGAKRVKVPLRSEMAELVKSGKAVKPRPKLATAWPKNPDRPPALKRPVWKDAKGLETPKPAAGKKVVHKKQHGLRGSALIHVADRLESKKAEYVAHTTLSEVANSFTMREKEIIAMTLHEVGVVFRASGSVERHLR